MTFMQKIEYILKNIDPIAFSERGANNILYTTKRYIPGSAVRGALAKLYAVKHKLRQEYADPVFYELFLSGKVRFLPAYPVGCRELAQGEPLVLPQSLMRSKDGSRTVDLAYDNSVAAGYKRLQGFAVVLKDKFYSVEPAAKIELHMSRRGAEERIKGSSRDGNVFNYEYLEPGQYFKGAYLTDEATAPLLEQVLQELELTELHLGRSKSAQYGKCRYQELQVEKTEPALNGKALYLLAQTPYIAYGSWQRVEQAAAELLQELGERLSVEFARDGLGLFAASENIDGYVGVWQAKKQTERALSAGSLIELRLQEGELKPEQIAELRQALAMGLGKNTVEGFGQFILWQPAAEIELQAELPQKQERIPSLSEEVRKRAAEIMRSRLLREVRQQAAADAQSDKLQLKKAGSVNNILKRIEGLMYSNKSKREIQQIISMDFRSTAQNNLRAIKYDWEPLYEILTEENNHKQPYVQIDWIRKLNIPKAEQQSLQKIFKAMPSLNENEVYCEYWLWFMRHAGKLKKAEGADR